MENIELEKIWKSHDEKIQGMLALNRELAIHLSRQKLNKQIGRLYHPKWTAILIGLPYTVVLIVVAIIAIMAEAYFVAMGFVAISLIMVVLLLKYFYQLYLIGQIRSSEEVLSTQRRLSSLRISSFNSLNLAVFQLPFWSICWISIDALQDSPFVYGTINLIVFLILSFVTYWLFLKLNSKSEGSRLRSLFLSGSEWEPIFKSEKILKQIEEYEK